jgi:alpha-tubulin suppressor-like RCC1 family protein
MTTHSKTHWIGTSLATLLMATTLGSVAAHAVDITPIVMWGANVDGIQTPPDPRYVDVFSAIALGDAHGLAILSPGRAVRGWGRNTFGQTTVPVVAGSVTYTDVRAGSNHTALLRSDGAITCVGANDFGQCDVDVIALQYTKVRCGSNFTLGVDLNGDVHAWGDNAAGQSTVPPEAVRTVDVAAGRDHVVLLTDSDEIVFWGDNSEGEQTQPTLGSGVTVTGVACGWDTTAFLLSDGTVQVVGDNTLLQQSVPALGTGETYSSLRALGYTLGALRSDGEIVIWGNTSNDLDAPPAAPAGTVYDDFQIGFGFAGAIYNLDCDDDGDSDLEQIAADGDLDCNIDNRIDSCEAGSLTFASSTVAPFASGDVVTLAFEDTSDTMTEVMVEIEVKADLGSPGEYLTLAFNGQVIDYVFPSGGANCPASFQKETIFIPAAMFNDMLEDGDATFTLSASSLVSEAECASSAAKMRVSYLDDSADCNGNGTPDTCELTLGEVSDMNGDGIPDTCQLTPVGDIDGDRKGDILWFNPDSRQFSAWFMNGLTRTAGGYVGENAPSGFSIGGVGDLDGDGRTDVVLRNTTTGAVRGMLLAGSALAESGPITGVVPSDYRLLAVVDIDGDGNDDILWKSSSTGKVFGWRMHGLARL